MTTALPTVSVVMRAPRERERLRALLAPLLLDRATLEVLVDGSDEPGIRELGAGTDARGRPLGGEGNAGTGSTPNGSRVRPGLQGRRPPGRIRSVATRPAALRAVAVGVRGGGASGGCGVGRARPARRAPRSGWRSLARASGP